MSLNREAQIHPPTAAMLEPAATLATHASTEKPFPSAKSVHVEFPRDEFRMAASHRTNRANVARESRARRSRKLLSTFDKSS